MNKLLKINKWNIAGFMFNCDVKYKCQWQFKYLLQIYKTLQSLCQLCGNFASSFGIGSITGPFNWWEKQDTEVNLFIFIPLLSQWSKNWKRFFNGIVLSS